MTSFPPTRTFRELTAVVERVIDGDQRFFERRPDRRHRIRVAGRAEIALKELVEGRLMTLPPGYRWYAVVRNVAPGVRWRLFIRNVEGAATDLCETASRDVFAWEARAYPDVEEELLKVVGGAP